MGGRTIGDQKVNGIRMDGHGPGGVGAETTGWAVPYDPSLRRTQQ
jgi:hypothetical protein